MISMAYNKKKAIARVQADVDAGRAGFFSSAPTSFAPVPQVAQHFASVNVLPQQASRPRRTLDWLTRLDNRVLGPKR